MTLPDLYRPLLLAGGLHASAARTPAKPALHCAGRTLSYGELGERVRRVTDAAILDLHIRPGERVAVVAPNCLEYPELVAGLSDAGAIVATLNPRSTATEITAACDDCGVRVLFAHAGNAAVAGAAKSRTVERTIVIGEDYGAWRDTPRGAAERPRLAETDPFTLVYSSGTTGKPKGIVISHRSRVLTFHAMAMEYGCYGPEDFFLALTPMAHGAGLSFTMAALYVGAEVELLPKFDAAQVLERLGAAPFTGVFLVPTHFQAIFALPAEILERHRGTAAHLKAIISNAAALPQALKQQIIAYFGPGLLHETYGSTEAGIVTNIRPSDQLRTRQSVGRPFASTLIRLLDENGREVPEGEVGELFSTSPFLFNGYWNNPQETRDCIRDGHWISAGDLARRDAEGFYYIVDRKKDMVISGGLNIFPREIEEVLHRHPAVLEAAVVGVPDPHWGESLRAYVVLRDAGDVSADALIEHCRQTLSGYKLPRELHFIKELPRNLGGKILKKELRALA